MDDLLAELVDLGEAGGLQVEHRAIAAAERHQLVVRCRARPAGRASSTQIRSALPDGGEPVADRGSWCSRGWRPGCGRRSRPRRGRRAAAVGSSSRTDTGALLYGGQGARQCDPLPLAAGELGAAVVPAARIVSRPGRARARRQPAAPPRRPRRAHRGVRRCRATGARSARSPGRPQPRRPGSRRCRGRGCPRRRPRPRRPAGRRAGTAAWRASSCPAPLTPTIGHRGAGGDGEVEVVEDRRSVARVVAERARRGSGSRRAGRPMDGLGIRWVATPASGHLRRAGAAVGCRRRGRAVKCPAQPAERDGADADGGLQVRRCGAQTDAARPKPRRRAPRRRCCWRRARRPARRPPSAPAAGSPRTAAGTAGSAPIREPVDHPVGEPEQPQLLGRRRVGGEAVGIVRVPLGRRAPLGVAVAPDPALPQQPVGRAPGEQQDQRRPPREARPARGPTRTPVTSSTRPPAMKSMATTSGGPLSSRVEVARHREVVGQLRCSRGAPCPAA